MRIVSALAQPAPTSKVRKLVNAAINSSALRLKGVADGIFETEVVAVGFSSSNVGTIEALYLKFYWNWGGNLTIR